MKNFSTIFLFFIFNLIVAHSAKGEIFQNSFSQDIYEKYIGVITDNAKYIAEDGDIVTALAILLELEANPLYTGNSKIEAAMRHIRNLDNELEYIPLHKITYNYSSYPNTAITNDGKIIYLTYFDKVILKYDVENNCYSNFMSFEQSICKINLSYDEKYLFIKYFYDGKCDLVDIETRKIIKQFDTIKINKLINNGHYYDMAEACISNDNKYIATLNREYLGIWDTNTENILHIVNLELEDRPDFVTFSNDGSNIIVYNEDTLIVINTKTGKICTAINSEHRIKAALFSPDGTKLLMASNGYIKTYDTTSGELIKTIDNVGSVFNISNINDSSVTVIGKNIITIENLWNDKPTCLGPYETNLDNTSILNTFSRNGKYILSYIDNDCQLPQLQIWGHNPNRNSLFRYFKTNNKNLIDKIVYNNDASIFITYDKPYLNINRAYKTNEFDSIVNARQHECNVVNVYNSNLELSAQLNGHSHKVTSALFSPDNKYIVTASMDSTIRIWDCKNMRCTKVIQDNAPINNIAISPQTSQIASTNENNELTIRSFNGTHLHSVTTDSTISQLTYSPNGKYLYTVESGKIAIRDASNSSLLKYTLDSSSFSLINLSKNGKWAITLQNSPGQSFYLKYNQSIQVWDLELNKAIGSITLESDDKWPYLEIGNDGKTLLIYYLNQSKEHKMLVYDIESGTLLDQTNTNGIYPYSITIAPDMNSIIMGTGRNDVIFWDYASRDSVINFCRKRIGNYKLTPKQRKVYKLD